MTEHFNKSEPVEGSHVWLHVVNALLLAGLWAFTIAMYRHLPERVPAHIGPSGVTRWADRDSGIWLLLPILGSVEALVMYAMAGLAGSSPQGLNVPQKKRLLVLPREGQRYAMAPLRPFMYGMATWLVVLMLVIQVHMFRTAQVAAAGDPTTGILPLLLLFTLLPLAGVVWLSRAVGRRIDAWEAREPEVSGVS